MSDSDTIVDPNMLVVKWKVDKKTKVYELPDGNIISLCNERFRCPEALFNPGVLGLEAAGIHEMTVQSIMKCGDNIWPSLYSNVVFSGRNTLFEGIQERMVKELLALAPPNMRVNVR